MKLLHLISGIFLLANSTALHAEDESLATARKGFQTHLLREDKESQPPEKPPEGMFDLVHYTSPAGSLAAYVSTAPKDDKKHPIIIWLTGGFGSSIDAVAWKQGSIENDQSAAAYRLAGLAMMYPSLRGGNDNPGHKEGFYGEVDDVLAATGYAAKLPWVDTSRIYLGGHSTGGTLALLTAECAPAGLYRAVISFGPVTSAAHYGSDNVPFDVNDAKEAHVRAPMSFLSSIHARTVVIEGSNPGNSTDLAALQKKNTNPLISFTPAHGYTHFTELAPANAVLAAKLAADTGKDCTLSLTKDEIDAKMEELAPPKMIAPGDIRKPRSVASTRIYYHRQRGFNLQAFIKDEMERLLPGVLLTGALEKDQGASPVVGLQEEQAPFQHFAPPSREKWTYVESGLQATDLDAIQKSDAMVSLTLVMPKGQPLTTLRRYEQLVASLSSRLDGFIWDQSSGVGCSREFWDRERVEGWASDTVPLFENQVVSFSRMVAKGEPMRLQTSGMGKLGFPEFVIPGISEAELPPASHTLNAIVQYLCTHPEIKDPGHLEFSVDDIEPADLAQKIRGKEKAGATGKIVVALTTGGATVAGSGNDVIRIDFRNYEGADEQARLSAAIKSMWGYAVPR